MRMGLGQALPSITLYDGTVISAPLSTPATAAQCLPYQCGVDSTNDPAVEWCSYWGQVAARTCMDPVCAPYLSMLDCAPPSGPAGIAVPPTLAQVFAPNTPAAIGTYVPPPQVVPNLPILTPSNVVQPLPDITATLAPEPFAPCGCWQNLNEWIWDNPFAAVAILLGGAFVLWPKGRR
jgi:hypothetical protein